VARARLPLVALTGDEQQRFLAALREDASFRQSVRREVLTDELLELPGRLAEIDVRLTDRLDRLTERLDRLSESVDALVRSVKAQQDDIGDLKGYRLQLEVERHPGGYLTPLLRKARPILEPELFDLLPDEADDVLRADLVARGRLGSDDQPSLAVVEVSWHADVDDLERALARAKLLAAATGERVLPMVVSKVDPGPAVRDRAEDLAVAVLLFATAPVVASGRPVQAA
jgi:hypothetical protein